MRIDVDGRTVFYSCGSAAAPDDAPAVLFLHGAAMDHTIWVTTARYFARHGCRVVAPDLPGHGRSAGQPLESIEEMAQWCVQLLDVLHIDTCRVVGHSMGSLIAHRLAVCAPQRIDGVALLGTSQPMPVTPLLLNAAGDDHPAAYRMANTWSHSSGAKLGGSPHPGQWMMAMGERLMQRCDDGVFAADLNACNNYEPAAADSGAFPDTLVIVGSEDQMTPAKAGRKVADNLSNARTVTLVGCGHSMMSERPNEVLDALADWAGVSA